MFKTSRGVHKHLLPIPFSNHISQHILAPFPRLDVADIADDEDIGYESPDVLDDTLLTQYRTDNTVCSMKSFHFF